MEGQKAQLDEVMETRKALDSELSNARDEVAL